ncbi:MAG: glycosyltransferase, partial [Thermodesulfobacteriota bacterium]
ILGLPELVRDGAGLLVPPHNPAALADAIQQIAQLSPEARDAMGRAGRRIVEDFDAVKGATRLLELIHSVRDDQTTSLSAKKTARHVTPTV